MDMALESGHVVKPKQGWYQKKGEEKNYRLADTNTAEFWLPILKDPVFREWVETKYSLSHGEIMLADMDIDDIEKEFDHASEV